MSTVVPGEKAIISPHSAHELWTGINTAWLKSVFYFKNITELLYLYRYTHKYIHR